MQVVDQPAAGPVRRTFSLTTGWLTKHSTNSTDKETRSQTATVKCKSSCRLLSSIFTNAIYIRQPSSVTRSTTLKFCCSSNHQCSTIIHLQCRLCTDDVDDDQLHLILLLTLHNITLITPKRWNPFYHLTAGKGRVNLGTALYISIFCFQQ